MKNLRIAFGKAVENATKPVLHFFSGGNLVHGGAKTHALLSARDNPAKFKKLLDSDVGEMVDIRLVFTMCVRHNAPEAVDALLQRYKDHPEIKRTIDFQLTQSSSTDMLEVLLKHGANPNTKSQFVNYTYPLHEAVRCRDERAVRALLNAGADVHVRCSEGLTPAQHFHPLNPVSAVDIFRLLVASKADLRVDSDDILKSAIWNADPRAVHFLVSQGADIHARDKKGRTMIELADEALENIRDMSALYHDFKDREQRLLETAVLIKQLASVSATNTSKPKMKL